MELSTNRKNRVLRAPATTDSCDIGEGDREGAPFAFWAPLRRDRALRLQDLNLLGSFRSRGQIAHKRRHLADYQGAAKPVTLRAIARR